jgi:hypothetical protein
LANNDILKILQPEDICLDGNNCIYKDCIFHHPKLIKELKICVKYLQNKCDLLFCELDHFKWDDLLKNKEVLEHPDLLTLD